MHDRLCARVVLVAPHAHGLSEALQTRRFVRFHIGNHAANVIR